MVTSNSHGRCYTSTTILLNLVSCTSPISQEASEDIIARALDQTSAMCPSSATTTAAAHAQCRGCSAPLPWASLGLGGMLMLGTAETRDLCVGCTLEYYYRTGGLCAGTSSSASGRHARPTCPFPFAAAATATPRPPPNRCAACRKKVGLLGFVCRCRRTFCLVHRHGDLHGCSFDYRKGFAREAAANR